MPHTQKRPVAGWPEDVGIIAIEVYFPCQYVDQSELEAFDGIAAGKYTIGLGQSKMGFCSDREDINSLCLTVVQRLVERNNLTYNDIGRLEVGTETIIDKSKSVKTVLMQLFQSSGNSDVEGVDTINACYGGTSALFNAVNWIESSYWDGRYALVVAGDIAVYASGNARPTGGAGAVAMLIGPNAPLIMERGTRSTHMQHAYDFYKPNMMSEYPTVDGKLSIKCYLSALDHCYDLFKQKANAKNLAGDSKRFTMEYADAILFHSPYCKLIQKSVGRLLLNDYLTEPLSTSDSSYAVLEKFKDLKLTETYFDREVEQALLVASKDIYQQKTLPYLLLANQVGNMYTPSLYGGLASFISRHNLENISGKRILLFSYGSGLASSMFSLRVSDVNCCTPDSTPARMLDSLKDLTKRLDSRQKIDPADFSQMMALRERIHHLAPYSPVGKVEDLFPGTWYLLHIDEKHRRTYERKKLHGAENGLQL